MIPRLDFWYRMRNTLGVGDETMTHVEGYGVKGVKSLPWRRTFPSVEAMNRWVEKNDAEVFATREVSAEEAAASKPSRR